MGGNGSGSLAELDGPTERNLADRLILNLHGVGPLPDWVGPAEGYYWCKGNCFQTLLDDVGTLSQRMLIELTFDDGNLSDATVALPALVERGLSASFFVCAGQIGQPGYLDRIAMRNLVSAGMVIGSHGWGHVDWRRVDDRALNVEIDDARKKIADIVGCDIETAAIPFGSYDRRVLRRLRRSAEIKTVYTSDKGYAPMSGWMLAREPYDASWNRNTLRQLVNSRSSVGARIHQTARLLVKRWR